MTLQGFIPSVKKLIPVLLALCASCSFNAKEKNCEEGRPLGAVRKLNSFVSPNLELVRSYLERRPDSVKYAKDYGADIVSLDFMEYSDTLIFGLSERFYAEGYSNYVVEHDSTFIIIDADYELLKKYFGMTDIIPNRSAADSLCSINYKYYPHKSSTNPRAYFERYKLMGNSFQLLDADFMPAEW